MNHAERRFDRLICGLETDIAAAKAGRPQRKPRNRGLTTVNCDRNVFFREDIENATKNPPGGLFDTPGKPRNGTKTRVSRDDR